MVAACGISCFGFQVVGMVWSWRLCVRFAACNKYNLLHLVGILFPHNNDDARSKSLQTSVKFVNSSLRSLPDWISFLVGLSLLGYYAVTIGK